MRVELTAWTKKRNVSAFQRALHIMKCTHTIITAVQPALSNYFVLVTLYVCCQICQDLWFAQLTFAQKKQVNKTKCHVLSPRSQSSFSQRLYESGRDSSRINLLDSFDRLPDLLNTLGLPFLWFVPDLNAYDTPHFLRFSSSLS